jgi:hypothetical protein
MRKSQTKIGWPKVDGEVVGLFENAAAQPVGGWLRPPAAAVKVQKPEERNDLEDAAVCENGLQRDLPWKVVADQQMAFLMSG